MNKIQHKTLHMKRTKEPRSVINDPSRNHVYCERSFLSQYFNPSFRVNFTDGNDLNPSVGLRSLVT